MPKTLLALLAPSIALAALACEPPGPARAPTVSLRMHGGPPGATVTIDDEFVGPLEIVEARGVALPLGKHRISVVSPGYLPWDKIVEAKDQLVRLDVQLVPVPE